MCRILAIANVKGGVGKTTTSVNVAAAFVENGQRVLAIDLDPQASFTTWLGFNVEHLEGTVKDILAGSGLPLSALIRHTDEGYDLVPANYDLARVASTMEDSPTNFAHLSYLRAALEPLRDRYDYVVLDCPASAGVLTGIGLATADEVIIPLTADYLTFQALRLLLVIIREIKKEINPTLQVGGIFYAMHDSRSRHARTIDKIARSVYGSGIPFFSSTILPSVNLKNAAAAGKSILHFAPDSPPANAYRALAKEIAESAHREPMTTLSYALSQGKELLARSEFAAAYSAFCFATEADGNSVEAWEGRAASAPEWDEAVRSYARAFQLQPDKTEIRVELQKRLKLGLAQSGEGDVIRLLNLAHHLADFNQRDFAEQLYQRVTEIDPVHEEGWLGRARTTANVQDAIKYVNRCIEISPSPRAQAALASLQQRTKPTADNLIARAVQLERAGRREQAHALYKQAADLDSSNEVALEGCARTTSDSQEAKKYSRQASRMKSENQPDGEENWTPRPPEGSAEELTPRANRSVLPFLLRLLMLAALAFEIYIILSR